jgi:hypothetical protein
MKKGLLWYDNQKNVDIKERISSAIDFFESKYGYLPGKCFVNPETLGKPLELGNKIKVIPNECVLANHFWLEFSTE